jgi:catechol 2,3-dioxygenase-like lactoylglutathione lyase family enzyme
MNKPYIHHILIAVDDLERTRHFYAGVLEMQEIDRPIGDGQQQLHILARSDATLRRNKTNDPCDIHFALRVKNSYRETLGWLHGKGFRDDVTDGDLRKMQLRPNSATGYPQIYILDPIATSSNSTATQWIEGHPVKEGGKDSGKNTQIAESRRD